VCTGTVPSSSGQRRRVIRLGSSVGCAGGLVGAIPAARACPPGAFKEIVPALIGIALLMIIFQPRLARWMAARTGGSGGKARAEEPDRDGGTGGAERRGRRARGGPRDPGTGIGRADRRAGAVGACVPVPGLYGRVLSAPPRASC